MKELTLSIPALLFPALSLLMIAYTSRFLGLADRARALHKEHTDYPSQKLKNQIKNLRKRLMYIRNMQAFAISGFFTNIISMLLIFISMPTVASYFFGASLVLLAISLAICFMEIYMSVGALTIQLCEDEEVCGKVK